jgi:hypothetical protein
MSTYKHANIVTKEHTKTNQNKQCVSTVCPGHLKIQLDPINVKYVLRTQRAKEGELLNVLVVCLVKNQIKAVLNVPNAMLVKQVLVVMVLVINAKQVNIVRAAWIPLRAKYARSVGQQRRKVLPRAMGVSLVHTAVLMVSVHRVPLINTKTPVVSKIASHAPPKVKYPTHNKPPVQNRLGLPPPTVATASILTTRRPIKTIGRVLDARLAVPAKEKRPLILCHHFLVGGLFLLLNE